MFNNKLTIAIGAALLSGIAMSSGASAEMLDREKNHALFTGATGTHWYLSSEKWYRFHWQPDGELIVTNIGAKPGDEPFAKGKWRIKSVEKKKDMSDEDVAKANAELQFVYCQQIEALWSGHELCWETQQVSFDVNEDKKPLPKQEYKLYREAGAETGEYIITRR